VIRISTHLWTSVDDIDKLVTAMDDLRRKMG
jgi:selenocysteine lyase/cysteine desulfurase